MKHWLKLTGRWTMRHALFLAFIVALFFDSAAAYGLLICAFYFKLADIEVLLAEQAPPSINNIDNAIVIDLKEKRHDIRN